MNVSDQSDWHGLSSERAAMRHSWALESIACLAPAAQMRARTIVQRGNPALYPLRKAMHAVQGAG
jgi:hypothetical protein